MTNKALKQKPMQCFIRNPQTSFIYEQIEHKVETVAAKPNASGVVADFEQKTEQAGQHLADSALNACSDVACAIETTEDPWKKETDQILLNISQDKSLATAFDTFLAEYVRQFGQSLELTDDPTTNFYTAIEMAGVPNSSIGFKTAWGDILRQAERGVADSGQKWPYERLKNAVQTGQAATLVAQENTKKEGKAG